MAIEYRQYQSEATDALLSDILNCSGMHPVAAVPTGAGKTIIIGSLMLKYLNECPKHNILVLSHTETILKQDYKTIEEFFPDMHIGLYSSGLGSRTRGQITVAGIQSVFKKSKEFKDVSLIVIDEAHTVPTKGSGMYRQFFKGLPHVVRVGFSGSHFRTGHGYIHEGNGALFNKLSYDLCTMNKFNKLVDDGYLTQLFSKPPELQLDTTGVKMSAGDYNLKALSKKFDRESITKVAVKQIVEFGHNYHSWLVFAIDIQHAEKVCEELHEYDIEAATLHSKSDFDRHRIQDWFLEGKLRCIVSVGMITTGFDAPNVDLIALLRPTTSPVLHVQMIGRGLRIHESKTHCLVLDFAGNTERLGPINNVQIPIKGKKKGTGKAVVKQCPGCGCLHHPTVRICNVCGHTFEFKQKLKNKSSGKEVVQRKTARMWLQVTNVEYSIHRKKNSTPSLKVKYYCGMYTISEYICYDHSGYAKYKADNWVKHRWTYDVMPPSLKILHEYSETLRQPSDIYVDLHNKYPIILDAKIN